jgi:hypothetical protein
MAVLVLFGLLFLWTLYGVYVSMSVSEAPYEVLEILEDKVEIRAYPEEIWATTFAEDQNSAFSPLFRYISGDNDKGEKIEMTAPVVTPTPRPSDAGSTKGEKIEMTAPVVSMNTEKGQFMAFIMPERFNINNTPRPLSSRVKIELVEPRKLATIRFSGYVTQENYKKNLEQLNKTLENRGFSTIGKPILMQYNDPWTPPFYRRNEIAIQVNQ